jgi:hypothetical protein
MGSRMTLMLLCLLFCDCALQVKQISYKGQNIEASWALGAAVNELSS